MHKKKSLPIFQIKKKFFSFLKINELKMSVFKIKRNLLLSKMFFLLLRNNKTTKLYKLKNKSIYSYFKNFNNVFHRHLSSDSYNRLDISDDLFRKGMSLRSSETNDQRTFGRELRIPRVKFKPGYQRLWRQFRLAFAESINYRYIYQQQLTRYFVNFYRKINHTYFSQNENDLYKVVIYSRLVPDLAVFNLFFDNALISLNLKVLKHKNIYLYKNDFVQLDITNWYYIYMRTTLSEVHTRHNKFKRLVYRKSLAGRYKLMKQRKQRSNYTPN
jgi:hypothetical protein